MGGCDGGHKAGYSWELNQWFDDRLLCRGIEEPFSCDTMYLRG